MKALLLAGIVTASLALATPVTSSQSQSTSSSANSPTAASTVSTTLSYSTTGVSGTKFTTPASTSLSGGVRSFDVIAPSVPEPGSVFLLGTGLLLLTMSARRLRRSAECKA